MMKSYAELSFSLLIKGKDLIAYAGVIIVLNFRVVIKKKYCNICGRDLMIDVKVLLQG